MTHVYTSTFTVNNGNISIRTELTENNNPVESDYSLLRLTGEPKNVTVETHLNGTKTGLLGIEEAYKIPHDVTSIKIEGVECVDQWKEGLVTTFRNLVISRFEKRGIPVRFRDIGDVSNEQWTELVKRGNQWIEENLPRYLSPIPNPIGNMHLAALMYARSMGTFLESLVQAVEEGRLDFIHNMSARIGKTVEQYTEMLGNKTLVARFTLVTRMCIVDEKLRFQCKIATACRYR